MNVMDIVVHTPLWVWGMLFYVVAVGIFFLKDRTSTISRALIAPIVLCAWSLIAVQEQYGLTPYSLGVWILGALLGIWLGRIVTKQNPPQLIDTTKGVFMIPGGVAFLGVLLTFFLLRYTRGVMLSLNPELMQQAHMILLDLLVTGLLIGFMIGRLIECLLLFRKR